MASHVCLENRNFRRARKRIVVEVSVGIIAGMPVGIVVEALVGIVVEVLVGIVVEVPVFEEVWKDNMGEVVPKVYKNLVRYYLKRKS